MQGSIKSTVRETHQEDVSVFTVGMEIHPPEHLGAVAFSSCTCNPKVLLWTAE